MTVTAEMKVAMNVPVASTSPIFRSATANDESELRQQPHTPTPKMKIEYKKNAKR
jgi:hypothetical protein